MMRRQEDVMLTNFKWPIPPGSLNEIRPYIMYGDLTMIAEEAEVSIFKVWDCLNRERKKYDLRLMLEIVKRAELNRSVLSDEQFPDKFALRKFIDKIYRFYKAKEQPNFRKYVRTRPQKDKAVKGTDLGATK